MSFRKPRVHLAGKSNADLRTISATPVKVRIPIQERTFAKIPNSFREQIENPIEKSIKRYKSWNKKVKNNPVYDHLRRTSA